MPTDPEDDRLLETALALTDDAEVDWERARRENPEVAGTLQGLEELAAIAHAHGAALESEGVASDLLETAGAPAARDAPVRRWGSLEIRTALGEGSFGEVWVAWDPRLQREVALKLRRTESGSQSTRWLQEARRLARVRHPNVITVHGADLHEGRVGLWMDRVRGRTLEDVIRLEGALGAREAALVGIELCGALAAVHGAGLVHGDIKTRNIMREGSPEDSHNAGRIVLMDFGSARESTAGEVGHSRGTPLFTAPEVMAGSATTPAADLYSLGVVLYRMVTADWPVHAQTLPELRAKLAQGIRPLRELRPDLPAALITVIERLLAATPAQRFANAAELERALVPVLGAGHHGAASFELAPHKRKRWPLGVGLAAVLALVVGQWVLAPAWPRVWWSWHARPAALAQREVVGVNGFLSNSYFGNIVEDVGDMDGDGKRDLLVGAPNDSMVGAAYLLPLTGGGSGQPTCVFRGEGSGDYFGCAAAAPGDLNGDGAPDLVIAAVYNDHDARDAGRVYIYWGGKKLHEKPDAILEGRGELQMFGWFVAPAGDLNADGWPDLIVGAPLDQQAGFPTGRAYVYFGGPGFDVKPDLELASSADDSRFGISVRGIGDFNADGYDDVAVGAVTENTDERAGGRAYVYYGGPHLDAKPDLVLRSHEPGSELGLLGRSGDVNGDGYSDLLVSAERAKGLTARAGSVFIYFGGPNADAEPDLHLRGERRGDVFGNATAVDASRDLDGDGADDILVGARWHDVHPEESEGRIYVFLGGSKLDAFPDMILDGKNPGGNFGWAACSLPSLQDGTGAIAVGSNFDSEAGYMAGATRVFEVARHVVVAPAAGKTWKAGAREALSWRGSIPADVSLSADDGRSWRPLTRRAGGLAFNTITVSVPAIARGHVRVRLAPSEKNLKGHTEIVVPVAAR